jgi:glycosyltransferase involved in cell wall biosynthesis
VGRLIEKKGFHILLEALHHLHEQGIRFRCCIAGEGPLRDSMEHLIREKGLRGTVRLLGAVPLDRLRARYYSRARVLAQPSIVAADGDRDGIPTVLLESMALGVPVVSTRVSGIPEAIENGKDGFLTDPGDAHTLAEVIGRLLDDVGLADRVARAARERIEREFDVRRNAGALRKLFLRSIKGWPPTEEKAEQAAIPPGSPAARAPRTKRESVGIT